MEATAADGTSFTRLHITPLDPDLLKVVVPPALLPRAANISYHTIETFPEKRYGFVDLPAMEADKIKNKLNGAVLSGVKIRIERARPESMAAKRDKEEAAAAAAAAAEAADGAKGKGKKSRSKEDKPHKDKKERKRKREGEEIVGVELEEGRKVKRGWTVPASSRPKERKEKKDKKDKSAKKDGKEKKRAKKETRSRYTDGPECLIKTVVPVAPVAGGDPAGGDADGGSKKRKRGKQTVIAHEFEKTVKFPTFLKSVVNRAGQSSKSGASGGEMEFVDGVGWVDADGKVVQPVRSTRGAAAALASASKQAKAAAPPSPPPAASAEDDEEDGGDTSSSGTSSDEEDYDEEEEGVSDREDVEDDAAAAVSEHSPTKSKPRPGTIAIPQASSPLRKLKEGELSSVSRTDSPLPKSAGSARSLTIKIPAPATPAASRAVHPLEALYRRPKPAGEGAVPAEEGPASFSFFSDTGDSGGGEEEDGDDEEDKEKEGASFLAPGSSLPQPPLTPFTRQDMEFRGMRSAAPTPDTAHHSRSFRFWERKGDEDDIAEEGSDDDGHGDGHEGDGGDDDIEPPDAAMAGAGEPSSSTAAAAAAAEGGEQTSDFQKWFWENRGDLNRAWKRRRKAASKEKRYRDHRSSASRAI